jgi:hypothetical protein
VAEKSRKRFRHCDELWLAIQGSARISEMISDILGVEDFEAVPRIESSRVFVLAFTGVYQWKRGQGWQQLTGEPEGRSSNGQSGSQRHRIRARKASTTNIGTVGIRICARA